jgi:outer membrane biosynthesis protein TonB
LALPVISIAQAVEETPVFEITEVEQKASFPGGDDGLQRYISKQIKYSPRALEDDAHGTINVMFVVKKDGTISDINLIGK